jgi:flagellum-specific peptidoglycan hydrolase FlgJ
MIFKSYLKGAIDRINNFIDKTNLRTILLTTLTIIFVVYCITRTINVRIVQHRVENTVEVYLPNDTLLSVSQSDEKITIPDLTIKTKNNPKYNIKKDSAEIFIEGLSSLAKQEAKKFGIPAAIKLAQGGLESNWGNSKLAKEANNYFGLKDKTDFTAKEMELIANRIKHRTKEFENNVAVNKTETFCVYETRWASFRHHSLKLRQRIDKKFNKGYAKMKNIPLKDYKKWAWALQESGYSTDPDYAKKLIEIIERYNLDRLDK